RPAPRWRPTRRRGSRAESPRPTPPAARMLLHLPDGRRRRRSAGASAGTVPRERRAPGVPRRVVELVFDAQKLVVLGDALGAGRRAGLDLAAAGRHGEVGDRGVFGLAAAVA